jgi:TPR repeat protein
MAAEQGDNRAQYKLGLMYFYGMGPLAKDFNEARRLFTLAADQNLAGAQHALGVF